MNRGSSPIRGGLPRARREDPRVAVARLSRDLNAARRALARGNAAAVAHTARGLLAALGSLRVRVELAHAAAAFAEAADERPAAAEWVSFAIAARAALETASKGAAHELAAELRELDASFEDARESVLLLEPEEYKAALAGTPPDVKAWWGERARIDRKMKEIDLERALSLLA